MGWTLLSEMRLWTTLGMGWDWGTFGTTRESSVREGPGGCGPANRKVECGEEEEDVQELGVKAKSEGPRSWGLGREASWPKEPWLSVRHTLALVPPSNVKDPSGK